MLRVICATEIIQINVLGEQVQDAAYVIMLVYLNVK